MNRAPRSTWGGPECWGAGAQARPLHRSKQVKPVWATQEQSGGAPFDCERLRLSSTQSRPAHDLAELQFPFIRRPARPPLHCLFQFTEEA